MTALNPLKIFHWDFDSDCRLKADYWSIFETGQNSFGKSKKTPGTSGRLQAEQYH